MCGGCGQDFHKEYKSDGWTRDDDSEGDSDSDAETEIDDDEDQDNFTNRVCGWHECRKDFDLFDPHYYDEEMGECFCCEECFKKEQLCCPWIYAKDETDDEEKDELNAAIDASGNALW
jgi:hypothetical protein